MSAATPAQPAISDPFSVWLDIFRWVAALAVVFTHTNNRFFVKVLSLPHDERSLPHTLFALASGWGRPAVIIFFVLSGFLVGGGALRKYRSGRGFDTYGYLAARFARLWIVLVPAFVLTFVLNTVGMGFLDGLENGIYAARDSGPYGYFSTSLPTFACNVVFMQNALCHVYGGNGALWTLFNEFWYYVAWVPLMFGLCGPFDRLQRTMLIGASLLLILVLSIMEQALSNNIGFYFIFWLMGTYVFTRDKPLISMPNWVAFAALIITMLAWRVLIPTALSDKYFLVEYACDAVIALLFANLLLVLKLSPTLKPPPLPTAHVNLVAFSFSLYAIHTPILNFYSALLMYLTGIGWKMVPSAPVHYLIAFSAIALSMAVAYVFSLVTEKHTYRLRDLFLGLRRKPLGGALDSKS